MSFKVICIDGCSDENATPIDGLEVFEGKIYTVVASWPHSLNRHGVIDQIPVYELAERPRGYGYAQNRFAPLSTIDEKELIQNRELVNT